MYGNSFGWHFVASGAKHQTSFCSYKLKVLVLLNSTICIISAVLQRGCVIDQEFNCVKMFCGIRLILLNIARNRRIKPLQPCFGWTPQNFCRCYLSCNENSPIVDGRKCILLIFCVVTWRDPWTNACGPRRSCTWLWWPVGTVWTRPWPWSNRPSCSAWRGSRSTFLPKTPWLRSSKRR